MPPHALFQLVGFLPFGLYSAGYSYHCRCCAVRVGLTPLLIAADTLCLTYPLRSTLILELNVPLAPVRLARSLAITLPRVPRKHVTR